MTTVLHYDYNKRDIYKIFPFVVLKYEMVKSIFDMSYVLVNPNETIKNLIMQDIIHVTIQVIKEDYSIFRII